MNDQAKYYTPTIEEFHVGFQYESFERVYRIDDEWDKGRDQWVKRTVLDINKSELQNVLVFHVSINNNYEPNVEWNKHIRVKHLNREDIESLGWEPTPKGMIGNGHIDPNDTFKMHGWFYSLSFRGHNPDLGDNISDRLIITSNNQGMVLFNGFIKNKSELKILLKQLNIEMGGVTV